jgi:hypothetical protein
LTTAAYRITCATATALAATTASQQRSSFARQSFARSSPRRTISSVAMQRTNVPCFAGALAQRQAKHVIVLSWARSAPKLGQPRLKFSASRNQPATLGPVKGAWGNNPLWKLQHIVAKTASTPRRSTRQNQDVLKSSTRDPLEGPRVADLPRIAE